MRQTVTNCMAKALMCQLKGAPAADDMPTVVNSYLEVFHMRGLKNKDAERVRASFTLWVQTNDRFPTPADILDGLPKHLHMPTQAPQIGHDSEAAQARSDAIAREHIVKWKAIAAKAWRDGDDWTEELALKYCQNIDTSPEGVAKAIQGNYESGSLG